MTMLNLLLNNDHALTLHHDWISLHLINPFHLNQQQIQIIYFLHWERCKCIEV